MTTPPDLQSRAVTLSTVHLGPDTFNTLWGDGVGNIYLANYQFQFVVSRDNGAQWATPQPSSDIINSIWGAGQGDVWAVGAQSIRHTVDTGFNWTQQTNPLPNNDLFGVWGSSALDVYAVGGITNGGRATILHSTDRGSIWSSQAVNVPGTLLLAVFGSGPSDVYAAGQKGMIVHSTDLGQTWTPTKSGVSSTLRSIWGSGPGDIYIAGGDAVLTDGSLIETGMVLHSIDRGATWKTVFSGSNDLFAVWGSGADDVYAVGTHSTILHSKDGGLSWQTIPYAVQAGFNGIWGTSANHFFVVGWDGQGGILVQGQ